MPATNPRIHLTLPASTYDAIASLAKLTGRPMAGLIRDFLEEAAPALHHLGLIAKTMQDMESDTQQAVAEALARHLAAAAMATEGLARNLGSTSTKAARAAELRRGRQGRPAASGVPRPVIRGTRHDN